MHDDDLYDAVSLPYGNLSATRWRLLAGGPASYDVYCRRCFRTYQVRDFAEAEQLQYRHVWCEPDDA